MYVKPKLSAFMYLKNVEQILKEERMNPQLPRIMLWTDKTSMEEFICEPINERLYDFYLELKGLRWHYGQDDSALLLFNEIYYQITKLEYEHNLDFSLDEYIKKIDIKVGREHNILFVLKMFFAFLLLRENNSNVASCFQHLVFYRYKRTWDQGTHNALGSIIREEIKYPVELKPVPCSVRNLNPELLKWDMITNSFNTSSIKEVVKLWSSKEERIIVLHLIEKAYKKFSRRPVKERDMMNIIRAGGNFFSDLYSELGKKDEVAAVIDKYMESQTATDADINENINTPAIPQVIDSNIKTNTIPDNIPEVLKTLEANQLMQKLVNAGILTEEWQPVDLSIAECGYLADEISCRLKIQLRWKVMGALWNMNSETLRQGKYKAVGQNKTSFFIDKLKNVLDR